jgi:hypothetical protein
MPPISDDPAASPLRIEGLEQSLVDLEYPDGGLAPAIGVHNFQVFRASRDRPDLADGLGYTFSHHVDMCCWRGRLYVAWNSCQKDEDIWPSRELYSTSTDGATWSPPSELFPQGVSMPLRMYFYHSSNDRMLVLGGLRTIEGPIDETKKGALIVRQIGIDHALGPVYLLRPPVKALVQNPPLVYTEAGDDGFIKACNELLDNKPFLEQQDYGALLGPRRMKWHQGSSWPGGNMPWVDNPMWVFGKGMSFFHRRDGALVGVSKMGFVTVSKDQGQTWFQPVVPSTLVIGSAKCWPQRTSDGRYALVYNPSRKHRYPLAVTVGDDGVSFANLCAVHGEVPIRRYDGAAKSLGPQYVRGISEWSSDGSRKDDALWVVYSVNKEDIWVARIPVPIRPDASDGPSLGLEDMATGSFLPGWNVYSPKWARVSLAESPDGGGKCLRLEDGDPYDYARATCVFPPAGRVNVSFDVLVKTPRNGSLEIELLGSRAHVRPVRVMLSEDGRVHAVNGDQAADIAPCPAGRWMAVALDADTAAGKFSLGLDGQGVLHDAAFAHPADALRQLSFRTGACRAVGGAQPVPAETDCPVEPAVFDIRNLRIRR